MQGALMIFVRNPVEGKVKTRLAQTLGAENALNIYRKLLAHTHGITKNIRVNKYVFYADFINYDDLWENELYGKELQNGLDLGERMKDGFTTLFNRGFNKIVIIGSDCYDLTEEIILTAFNELQHKEVVIGPAKDGGYYLLGMNQLITALFLNKPWSTGHVLTETIKETVELGYSIFQLPVLADVDEASDVTFNY